MSTSNVFQKLVDHFGSARKLAEALNVKPQSVGKWRNQIPAERVREIERLTDRAVTRYEMRPDVFGETPDGEAA
jgi:DNA-binding transcriptional regulator YdaS (Cro superfamily)